MSEVAMAGGPAFPLQSIGPSFSHGYCGMSLRDYFAAQVIVAAWNDLPKEINQEIGYVVAAKTAYAIADAMLKEGSR